MLSPGDPAPWFYVRSTVNSRFSFNTVGGRYIVLCFFGSTARPDARRVLDDVQKHKDRFDSSEAIFLGVSVDPEDEKQQRLTQDHPGIIWFWDFDRSVSRNYAAAPVDATAPYQPHTLVLDPTMRVVAAFPLDVEPEKHVERVLEVIAAQPTVASLQAFAPVIVVPRVFEPELCRTLIKVYEQQGGIESGFMRDVGGKTVRIFDYGHKRRKDCDVTDPELIRSCQARLVRRLVPEIHKAFQFHATRIERHIVACYDAATSGHFKAHRDNSTRGTAHRRFAVTINLNADEFEGGELRFPEFGPRTYKAPTGGAVVFSCSLLHEATQVTKGLRYAFLPFLYDEEAAKVRQANMKFVDAESGAPPSEAATK